MRPRDKTLTPALCISLIAHGLGLSGLAWWLVWTTPPPKYPAPDRLLLLVNRMLSAPPVLPPPKKSEAPRPKPPELKPKQPEKYEKPQKDFRDDSGEANGHGTANRSTDGKGPMLANAGPVEQADLMKAADQIDPLAILPASKGELAPNNAPPQKAPTKGSEQKATVKPLDPSSAVASAVDGVGPLPTQVKPSASGASQNHAPTPKPVQRRILGHKATVSDTESVAFAKADHRVFEAGKLEGRKGLRTRTTIPKWGDAAEGYLRMAGYLHAVLGVTVDADGNVLDVTIIESSGSEAVDQDLKNEVWNNWNLEPSKDTAGNVTDPHWTIVCE